MSSPRQIIFDFIGRNKVMVIATLLAALLSNFLNVLLPLSIGKFYEVVLHDLSVKGKLFHLLPFSINTGKDFFIFFGTVILLKGLFTYLENFLTSLVGERLSTSLRELAFKNQLAHSLASFQRRSVGKYLLRYSGDLRAVQNFVSRGLLRFTGDIFFLICAITALWVLQPKLTVIVIVIFSIGSGMVFLLSRKMHTASLERRTQRSKVLDFVSSRLQAFYTIKSFNRETPEQNSFKKRNRRQYQASIRYHRVSALVQSLIPVFFFGTLALMLFMVMLDSEKSPVKGKSNIFVFVLLFLYMQGVIRRLLRVNLIWQEGKISLTKLVTLFNLPSEKRTTGATPDDIKGNLVFNSVSFSFADNPPVIKNLSFEILAGGITLIKGKQGVGKSTLFKLIQKIYVPQEGEILLDKINYSTLDPFYIRKEVTIVSNETPLLGSSVFKVISYKDEPEKREDAKRILEQLKIKFDDDPDSNLDFKIGENGKNISAGQKIMLQFVRAFLTRKPIILLDEPFQYLDTEAQVTIVERLNKLKNKRTILLISDNVPEGLSIDQIIQL